MQVDLLLALIYVAVPIAMVALLSWASGTPLWRLAAGRGLWFQVILWLILATTMSALGLPYELQMLIVIAIGVVITIWSRSRARAA